MKPLIIIAALCLSVFSQQPDTAMHNLDPVYTTGTIGQCSTGPRQYVVTWTDSTLRWYGMLQFRSSDTSPWVDCWSVGLGEFNEWQYDRSRLVISDRYGNVNPAWHYRIILW